MLKPGCKVGDEHLLAAEEMRCAFDVEEKTVGTVLFAPGRGGGCIARGPQRQAPQPQTNPSGRPRNPFDDLFGKMFETGAQQRDDYQKGVETIFDQFKRDMDRR